jgi:hypothetical protein
MYWMYRYAKIRFFIHNLKMRIFKRKPKIIIPVKPEYNENDPDFVNKIGSYYIEIFINDSDTNFNKYEKTILYSNLFINELGYGSFSGLLYHEGENFEQIIEALIEIKLNSYVEILKNILSKFPNNKYDEEKANEEIELYCNSLNYDIDEISDAIKKYIIQNKKHFI